jgi:hypothetical protein
VYVHAIYVYECICHIFLIHSSDIGHLGYFHSLAIVNSAAINMAVPVFYCILAYFPSGISLGMVLLDAIVALL